MYTVGFYDSPSDGVARPVTVRVKRPGLQAVHPSSYLFRSEQDERVSLYTAAFHAPSMFDKGVVRAHVFPLRPTDGKTWDGLLAISFPMPFGGDGESETRDFGAVLSRGSSVAHRFDRRLTLVPNSDAVRSAPLVTFVERVSLSPGSYRLAVVMADPDAPVPDSTEVTLDVPELPRGELTVLQPILGSRAGADLVLIANEVASSPETDRVGDIDSFRPLLVQQIDGPTEIVALNRVCRIGKKSRRERGATVGRSFRAADGTEIGGAPPVDLELDPESRVACQDLIDVVPAAVLPEGEYVFEAWVADGREHEPPLRSESRFAVAPRPGAAPPAHPDE